MPQVGLNQMSGTAPSQSMPQQIVSAYVSNEKPAPSSPDDPAYVVVPSESTETSVPMWWPPMYGVSLPVQGTECLVAYDENGVPWVFVWKGHYSP